MTDELAWSDATEADLLDIRALRCSDGPLRGPDGELVRPRHELEVEVGLEEELSFPLNRDEGVLIARDTGGVAAVSWWWHTRADAKDTKLLVMAVSARWRKRHLGDDLLRRTLDRIIERADSAGVRVITVWGCVRIENNDSREFMSRNRFWEDASGGGGPLTEWYHRIDLPGLADDNETPAE